MDPITMLVAASAASTAMSVVGSMQQGRAQAANYGMQKRAAQHNARLAEQEAQQAREAGLQNELGVRQDTSRQMGALRAAVGESGFDAASGSGMAVQQQAAQDMEMQALSARYGALLQGYGGESQAGMDRYSARVAGRSGRNARAGGYMGAATNLLGGAVSLYGKKKGLEALQK